MEYEYVGGLVIGVVTYEDEHNVEEVGNCP